MLALCRLMIIDADFWSDKFIFLLLLKVLEIT